jgi:hypothetical protein
MTATIGWSYQQLPEPARQLLARLTVFAAPFTKDAADAVSRDAAGAAEDLAVLLDHSMVSPAERLDGERAFRMLNMIHNYAAERLQSPDDTLGGLERYLLGVLERASPQHGSQDWARRLLDSETPTSRSSSHGQPSDGSHPVSCSGGSAMYGYGCWPAGNSRAPQG